MNEQKIGTKHVFLCLLSFTSNLVIFPFKILLIILFDTSFRIWHFIFAIKALCSYCTVTCECEDVWVWSVLMFFLFVNNLLCHHHQQERREKWNKKIATCIDIFSIFKWEMSIHLQIERNSENWFVIFVLLQVTRTIDWNVSRNKTSCINSKNNKSQMGGASTAWTRIRSFTKLCNRTN